MRIETWTDCCCDSGKAFCIPCTGTGKMFGKMCSTCRGKGYTKCENCKGTGKKREFKQTVGPLFPVNLNSDPVTNIEKNSPQGPALSSRSTSSGNHSRSLRNDPKSKNSTSPSTSKIADLGRSNPKSKPTPRYTSFPQGAQNSAPTPPVTSLSSSFASRPLPECPKYDPIDPFIVNQNNALWNAQKGLFAFPFYVVGFSLLLSPTPGGYLQHLAISLGMLSPLAGMQVGFLVNLLKEDKATHPDIAWGFAVFIIVLLSSLYFCSISGVNLSLST